MRAPSRTRALAWAICCCVLLAWSWTAAAEDYTIGPGDRIAVSVFKHAELSGEARVTPGGTLNLPLIQSVPAAGLSLPALQAMLTQRLRQDAYLLDPHVSVELTESRPVFVTGDVARPGTYPFQPGMTVSRALAAAGGPRAPVVEDISAPLVLGQTREKIRQAQQTAGLAILRKARLIAERAAADDFTVDDTVSLYLPADRVKQAHESEVALLRQHNAARQGQKDVQAAQLAGFVDEIANLHDQSAAKQQEAAVALEESTRIATLQRQGLAVRDSRVNDLQRLAIQLSGERSQIGVEIARARENIARINEAMNTVTTAGQADLLTAIKDADDLMSATAMSLDESRAALAQTGQLWPMPGADPAHDPIQFRVERGGEAVASDAQNGTALRPGDLLIVSRASRQISSRAGGAYADGSTPPQAKPP